MRTAGVSTDRPRPLEGDLKEPLDPLIVEFSATAMALHSSAMDPACRERRQRREVREREGREREVGEREDEE
jgi:hypothetical protein